MTDNNDDYVKDHQLPSWQYSGTDPKNNKDSDVDMFELPPLNLDFGTYVRSSVSNLDDQQGRAYFNLGLRVMLSYQHELAAKYLLACLHYSPYCALAHGLVSLCHSPNYNFKGWAYYQSACHYEDAEQPDLLCVFPSQQVADRHSKLALDIIEKVGRIRKQSSSSNAKASNKKGKVKGKSNKRPQSNGQTKNQQNGHDKEEAATVIPERISTTEVQLLQAIRVLTGNPGIDPDLSNELVGVPYSDAMRKIYQQFGDDPEIAYFFAESLMVMNAWQLYEYPSGKPICKDVVEVRTVLEKALVQHPQHAGLCHLYVHLSEMSAHPELALQACKPLCSLFPNAGHLIHMPTHIYVLLGDYYHCVIYNEAAIEADLHVMEVSPSTSGLHSFFFGYITHNYHMAVYGCILGGFKAKAMKLASELNKMVNEDLFTEYPDHAAYLESYSSLDIHVMIRFGQWQEILDTLVMPVNELLMLYRAAQVRFAKAIAYASLNDIVNAKLQADEFDKLCKNPEAHERILHNNSIAALLKVDAVMIRGEIAYRQQEYDEAFVLLKKAVTLQDNLNYDEPWGKMQPVRHALGGLLLEQGQYVEAEDVFRQDLKFHPNNPWALVGLLQCLKQKQQKEGGDCCQQTLEIGKLATALYEQQQCKLVDFKVTVACECCRKE